VAPDQDNINASLAFLVRTGEFDDAARLLRVMCRFLQARGRVEHPRAALAELLAHRLSDGLRADLLSHLSGLAADLGDAAAAIEAGQEAVRLARPLGRPTHLARALAHFGYALSRLGDQDAAGACYLELEQLTRFDENAGWRGVVLNNLGVDALLRGDYAKAIPLFEEAVELATLRAVPLNNLGLIALEQGRRDDALRYYTEGLQFAQSCGMSRQIASSVEGVAFVVADSEPVEAARLLAAAGVEQARMGLVNVDPEKAVLTRTEKALLGHLGKRRLSDARDAGAALTLDQAVELALAVAGRLRG
jgi:tetratricopeptide (TPR) repeat protein